ncbi:hypothetical protein [Streptomyces sp. NPDC088755]|uniref:hypothetical protein n=2 Tax=Streptomyces TaxID=1883 RepID=UPI003829EB4B
MDENVIDPGFAPSDCAGKKGAMLTSDTAERWLQVHLHEDDGAVIFLWDTDAGFPPYEGAERTNTLWKAVLAEVPDTLRSCLWNGKAEMDDDDLPYVSAVMWRLPGDPAWRTAEALRQASPAGPWGGDCADSVLADLIAPSPATVMFDDGSGVERSSFATADAVRRILALRPLTEGIVRSLDPERSLADVEGPIAALGHRPADPDSAPPLDRGKGEGDALITMPPDSRFTLRHFLMEPDGEGFHRILVHDSGKALEAALYGYGVWRELAANGTDGYRYVGVPQ